MDDQTMDDQTIEITVCYQDTTPESIEAGGFDDQGVYERTQYTIQELAQIIAYCEPSCCPITPGDLHNVWFTTLNPDKDYQTGRDRYYTYHLDNPGQVELWKQAIIQAGHNIRKI